MKSVTTSRERRSTMRSYSDGTFGADGGGGGDGDEGSFASEVSCDS